MTGGWLTAEYSMLPYSTQTRKPRDVARGRLDGRSVEIQCLIGRSLRAVVDLEKLGPRTIWVDCDVLQADGGTRSIAITGASLALAVACRKLVKEKKLDAPPMQKLVAAVSAGILDGQAVLDLNYEEDKLVTVDFNLVVTEDGEFVEVQGSGEEATFAAAGGDDSRADPKNVNWAIISDAPRDKRGELRFSATHELVWQYLTENFEPVESACLPKSMKILHRKRPGLFPN